jgi:circadian clock protein KaiB
MKTRATKTRAKALSPGTAEWDLRLYVAGASTKSVAAVRNLERLCEQHLAGRYHIDVIDLVKTPQLAQGDQIVALPALVRHLPAPIRKVFGDLSDTERVIVGLDLRARATGASAPERNE